MFKDPKWHARITVMIAANALYLLFFAYASRYHRYARTASCVSNGRILGSAIRMYANDNDGILLPASVVGGTAAKVGRKNIGWSEIVAPYSTAADQLDAYVRHCPIAMVEEVASQDPEQRGYCTYWLNSHVAVYPVVNIREANSTLLLGEGEGGDSSYSLGAIPERWMGSGTSPLKRHVDMTETQGADFVFCDGHAAFVPFSGKRESYRLLRER